MWGDNSPKKDSVLSTEENLFLPENVHTSDNQHSHVRTSNNSPAGNKKDIKGLREGDLINNQQKFYDQADIDRIEQNMKPKSRQSLLRESGI